MATYLYRHFDKNNSLLYVGITADPDRRTKQHRAGPWGAAIARTTVKEYPTRIKAAIAELRAMESESPRYNRIPHGEQNCKLGVAVMFAVRVPRELLEQVDVVCKEKKINKSRFARGALEKALKGEKRKCLTQC